MKKIIFMPILFCIFLLNIAGTCCDDDTMATAVAKDATPVVNTINNGTWKITYFFDDNSNKTSLFSGHTFTFGSNTILTANKEVTVYSGNWSVLQSDVVDYNSGNDLDFSISFSSPDHLVQLSNNWDVFERTTTRVILRDLNGGTGVIDYLTFEKN
ncbi:hypothetical protein ACM55M_10340 [Flavobacterium sp. ZT3R25]|uniref:hypothetical protein n=1 Tax=Flavobacterium galactosi TaxID=3398735 RepID=UPI003A8A7E45